MRREAIADDRWLAPADDMKGGRDHLVLLSPLAARIVEGLMAEHDSPWLIASLKRRGEPVTEVKSVNAKLRKLSGIADLGTHVLRKTGATVLKRLLFSQEVVDACLGVLPAGVGAKHYTFYAHEREKKAAFLALGAHVEALVHGEPAGAKILHLRTPS